MYVQNIVLYGSETWTLNKKDNTYQRFQKCCVGENKTD